VFAFSLLLRAVFLRESVMEAGNVRILYANQMALAMQKSALWLV